MITSLTLLILSLAALYIGAGWLVQGSSALALKAKISPLVVGLTIVAFGTSLPELVTSVMAAKKGDVGIAIGNIVGSNIFNILFVIGTTALICTVPFEPKFLIDSGVAVFSGILLWVGTFRHKELRRSCGIVMLLCYAAYFAYLCM